MTTPDEPTQVLPSTPKEPGDRRAVAIVAGMGLALLAGVIVWAIVASSGDDDSITIGTTTSSAPTSTTAPAPTAPTLAPTVPPPIVTVPTTATTPGSVIIVPTEPTSPAPTTGPTTSTTAPRPTSTTRPRVDVAALTAALTEALLGPDAEPPAEPVVRVSVRRRALRVTWAIGNADDLELARVEAYDELRSLLETLVARPELAGRRFVLDGTYPLDESGDGTADPTRVVRLVYAAGVLDGVDLAALDDAGLVALAAPAVVDPAFEPAGVGVVEPDG